MKFSGVMAIFIVVIMVISVIGFVIVSSMPSNRFNYKGYVFSEYDGRWVSYYSGKKISLSYDPRLLEDELINGFVSLSDFNVEKIYVVSDPRENVYLVKREFFNNIGQFLEARLVNACDEDLEVCRDLPIKSCSDVDDDIGVILFEESDNNEVSYVDGCLVIRGRGEGLIRKVDKLVLVLLGIE